jgi:hypothetical protein
MHAMGVGVDRGGQGASPGVRVRDQLLLGWSPTGVGYYIGSELLLACE